MDFHEIWEQTVDYKRTTEELIKFLANVNMSSRSLYAIARPSLVCLSVCDACAPYSAG